MLLHRTYLLARAEGLVPSSRVRVQVARVPEYEPEQARELAGEVDQNPNRAGGEPEYRVEPPGEPSD